MTLAAQEYSEQDIARFRVMAKALRQILIPIFYAAFLENKSADAQYAQDAAAHDAEADADYFGNLQRQDAAEVQRTQAVFKGHAYPSFTSQQDLVAQILASGRKKDSPPLPARYRVTNPQIINKRMWDVEDICGTCLAAANALSEGEKSPDATRLREMFESLSAPKPKGSKGPEFPNDAIVSLFSEDFWNWVALQQTHERAAGQSEGRGSGR